MQAVEVATSKRQAVFSRVVVGIDGSQESREAARQAAILVEGELTLLASYDIAPAIAGASIGVPAYLDVDGLRAAAEDALGRAHQSAAAASPTGLVVRGRPADELVSEVERSQGTLVVVGSHEYSRLAGFVLGSTATGVVHKAPCSVLVARRTSPGDEFPTKVVVGVDGSRRVGRRVRRGASTVRTLRRRAVACGRTRRSGSRPPEGRRDRRPPARGLARRARRRARRGGGGRGPPRRRQPRPATD